MEKSDIIFQLNHITQEFPGVKAFMHWLVKMAPENQL